MSVSLFGTGGNASLGSIPALHNMGTGHTNQGAPSLPLTMPPTARMPSLGPPAIATALGGNQVHGNMLNTGINQIPVMRTTGLNVGGQQHENNTQFPVMQATGWGVGGQQWYENSYNTHYNTENDNKITGFVENQNNTGVESNYLHQVVPKNSASAGCHTIEGRFGKRVCAETGEEIDLNLSPPLKRRKEALSTKSCPPILHTEGNNNPFEEANEETSVLFQFPKMENLENENENADKSETEINADKSKTAIEDNSYDKWVTEHNDLFKTLDDAFESFPIQGNDTSIAKCLYYESKGCVVLPKALINVCPICGAKLFLRGTDQTLWIGCSRYRPSSALAYSCKFTMNLSNQIQRGLKTSGFIANKPLTNGGVQDSLWTPWDQNMRQRWSEIRGVTSDANEEKSKPQTKKSDGHNNWSSGWNNWGDKSSSSGWTKKDW